MVSKFRTSVIVVVLTVLCLLPIALHQLQAAADVTTDAFSLQVSPSPLVATIKPGVTSTLDLQIRNTSSKSQALKMGLQAFTVNETSGVVNLGKGSLGEVGQFVHFSNPTFSIQSGAFFTQHILVATPATAGFTYSFTVTISQQSPPDVPKGSSAIRGTVAVFSLLNVDRPGATRSLQISQLTVTKHTYEYLPATIKLSLRNTGNTLAQPKGTLFIQRHSNDAKPIAAIDINKAGGYILPGSSRTLTNTWSDGFPHYESTATAAKPDAQMLSWGGGDITKLRFGRYIAKVVAVYNDGNRDVPLTAEVSFWVIPWRMILVALLFIIIFFIGTYTMLRKFTKVLRRKSNKPHGTP